MSWLVRSLAAPFEDHEDEKNEGGGGENSPTERGAGVKEDLSQLKNALKKQLWGVASFIAPPPQIGSEKSLNNGQEEIQEMDGTRNEADGIRTDLSQLSGRVRSGFSRLSTALQSLTTDEDIEEVEDSSSPALNFPASFSGGITEISKLASSFLPLNSGKMKEEGDGRVVGLTDEVLSFAANISQHPGTWLDFPLDSGDYEDFDMSDVQQEHALAVERLIPNLASLRLELCPGYISDGQFWKIYFVLLHPQLSKEDALLLTTPQILEARALLSNESQKRDKARSISAGRSLGSPEKKILLMPHEQSFEHFSPVVDSSEKEESFKSVSLETNVPVSANNSESEGDYHFSRQRDLSNDITSTEDVEHDDEDAEVDNWLLEEPALDGLMIMNPSWKLIVDVRLKWLGLFHRRKHQYGRFMMRLKLPNGVTTSLQTRYLASVIEKYGAEGCANITTRQNWQIRGVVLDDVPAILKGLKEVGLSSLQSGMDNVRNPVGNPLAGIDPDEIIDTRPYTKLLTDYIVNNGKGNPSITNL